MKLFTNISKPSLLVALGLLSVYPLKAQEKGKMEKKDVIRLKMSAEKDGKMLVLDTTIENAEGFDVNDFVRSKGFDMPPTPAAPGSAVVIKRKGANGEKCADQVISIPSAGNKTMIIKEFGRSTACTPAPPIPPIPPDALKDEKKLRAFLKNDSFYSRAIVIGDEDLQEAQEIWINDEPAKDGIKNREVRVFVSRKVFISKLDEKDKELLGADKKSGALKVEHISFFPNPNNGRFKLSLEMKDRSPFEIAIMDKTGKKVYSEKVKDFSGKYEQEIDLTSQEKGTYYLQVLQGRNKLQQKIVIE